jgi:hypothetical protein
MGTTLGTPALEHVAKKMVFAVFMASFISSVNLTNDITFWNIRQ